MVVNLRTVGVMGEDVAGEGLIAEAFDRALAPAGVIMIGGTVYLERVHLHAGDVVTNLHVAVTAAGVAVSLSKVGLYSKAGARLALSADLGVAWQSTGLKTHPLIAAYKVDASDDYYVAAVAAAGTTLPTLLAGSAAPLAGAAVGAGLRPFAAMTGQADLPATATFAGAAPISYWMGLS